MAKVQLEIDVGDLEARIVDAVYERVRANFGALMADALRGGGPAVAPAAPVASTPPAPLVRPRGAPVARPVPVPMPWAPPAPTSTKDRDRLPPAARAVLERADRIYEAIKATPWIDAPGIAAATGLTAAELLVPLALLRGKDSRGKPTGEAARIQDAGSRLWKRYAVVGVKVPTDLR